jgi:hypothetical protein
VSNKEQIRAVIKAHPQASDRWISDQLGVHRKTVWSVRKQMQGTGPAKVDVLPGGRGWHVTLNGRLWGSFETEQQAEAEAEWLRWPKAAA